MLRIPAVCLLMLIQLFAGSGASIYICVASDGSVSGFDSGPLFCTNCDHGQNSDSSKKQDSNNDRCCGHRHDTSDDDTPADSTIAAADDDDCPCIHRLISAESVRRQSQTASNQLMVAALAVLLPESFDVLRTVVRGNFLQRRSPPPDKPAALVALSTVVIRC